ncbi:MAG: hypothetical protein ACE5HE_05740 [Phycisphaerae bacterium]
MKSAFGLIAAASVFASAASGANLNVSVKSGGLSEITVNTGDSVPYSVMGQLDTDADNRGLALVGFDLELVDEATGLQAAPLTKADIPTSQEMLNFAVPLGINNPDESQPGDGFGGTVSNGKLLQCGGAQNTINNTVDCTVDSDCPGSSNLCDPTTLTCTASAPFPTATTVFENLGHTEIELLKGTLTAPGVEGRYILQLSELFANVISTTQNSPDFLASEAAGVGTISNLIINVTSGCAAANVVASSPANMGSLWRSAKNIMRFTFDGDLTAAPTSGEIEIVECLGAANSNDDSTVDVSSSFNISIEDPGTGPRVLRLQETGATGLNHRSWYKVRNASWACVAPFEFEFLLQIGDCDGNKFVTPADLSCINNAAAVPGIKPDDARCDIDGNRFCTPADLSVSNAHPSGFVMNNCD